MTPLESLGLVPWLETHDPAPDRGRLGTTCPERRRRGGRHPRARGPSGAVAAASATAGRRLTYRSGLGNRSDSADQYLSIGSAWLKIATSSMSPA